MVFSHINENIFRRSILQKCRALKHNQFLKKMPAPHSKILNGLKTVNKTNIIFYQQTH